MVVGIGPTCISLTPHPSVSNPVTQIICHEMVVLTVFKCLCIQVVGMSIVYLLLGRWQDIGTSSRTEGYSPYSVKVKVSFSEVTLFSTCYSGDLNNFKFSEIVSFCYPLSLLLVD
jgi:hypothetical protein